MIYDLVTSYSNACWLLANLFTTTVVEQPRIVAKKFEFRTNLSAFLILPPKNMITFLLYLCKSWTNITNSNDILRINIYCHRH